MYKVIQFYGVIILRTTVMHLFIKVLCLFVKITYQNKLIEKYPRICLGKNGMQGLQKIMIFCTILKLF